MQSVVSPDAASNGSANFSAGRKVLSLVEILEHILLQLPDIRDLIICQGVSRHWKAVIDDSKLLQCALFYDTMVPSEEIAKESTMEEPERPAWKLNPLLPKFVCGKFHAIGRQTGWGGWRYIGHLDATEPCDPESEDEDIKPKKQLFPIKDGSWRKMRLSDPPSMGLKIVIEDDIRFNERYYDYEKSTYMTLGDLADQLPLYVRQAVRDRLNDGRSVFDWKLPIAINMRVRGAWPPESDDEGDHEEEEQEEDKEDEKEKGEKQGKEEVEEDEKVEDEVVVA